MDLTKVVDKKYEATPLKELVNAPVDALYGVSAGDAEKLKAAFNVKTISDLANLKYIKAAQAICAIADLEK